MKIPNKFKGITAVAVSLARIVSEDSQHRGGRGFVWCKSSKDS